MHNSINLQTTKHNQHKLTMILSLLTTLGQEMRLDSIAHKQTTQSDASFSLLTKYARLQD